MQTIIQLDRANKAVKRDTLDIEILKPTSLSIEQGEFVGICGKSGSGKSTLLNLMSGIDRPSSGNVHCLGQDINAMSVSELDHWRGSHIGFVFQFFQLIPNLSAIENVILPMDLCKRIDKTLRRKRAMELLEQVGLADKASQFPSILSGGEQQRVAIARALANEPPILFGDEPTGNLDSENAKTVLSLFSALNQQGKTIVIVSHDETVLAQTKRVIPIHDGQIKTNATEPTEGQEAEHA